MLRAWFAECCNFLLVSAHVFASETQTTDFQYARKHLEHAHILSADVIVQLVHRMRY